MKEQIICYDIDGTLTTEMLFVPLIKSEHNKGLLDDASYARIVETLGAYKRGEIAYEQAVQELIEKHASGLAGKEASIVADHAHEFIHTHTDLFRPFARNVIDLLSKGYQQLAVTAEPQYVADALSEYLGLDSAYASVYEMEDGRYTGSVAVSLADRRQKSELLVNYDVFAAFGDSEGDIDMLASSQNPICINPSTALLRRAESEAWSVFTGEEDSLEIMSVLR